MEIAVRLRTRIREQVGLPITVGVARTKFLAKVASGVAKPDGLLMVPPEGELAFLHPLAVERLWGVGPVTARKLHRLGIATVAEVARIPETELMEILGRASGRHLHALAHNRDPRRVRAGRRRRSMGAQRALGRGSRSPEELDTIVVALVDRLARRLRAARRVCRTVVIRLRFRDFTRATRSHTLLEATAKTQVILATARELLAAAMPTIEVQGLTLIGVALGSLEDEGASSWRFRSTASRPQCSMRCSTTSATGSDPPRSPERCSSAATRASRYRSSPIEGGVAPDRLAP